MQEETLRCALRLMAVATMLVGAIRLSTALVAWVQLQDSASLVPEGVSLQLRNLGGYSLLAELAVLLWGGALWGASAGLARAIRS